MKIFRTLARSARNVRDFFAAERVVVAPFTRDLRSYDMPKFRADAWAAANVTALALAQAIAFAAIAGLPVVYGIVSTAVAAFVAPLFAGSRHTILGPTNATAFMLFSFFAAKPMLVGRWNELIPLLVLMVGLMAVVGALFRLADLLQYVSRSVLVGYISGAAVLIVANQLKPFLGLGGVLDDDEVTTFAGLVIGLVEALPQADWVSLLIGVTTLLAFAAVRRWRPRWPAFAVALLLCSVTYGVAIRSGWGPFKGVATFETFGFDELMFKMPNLIRAGIFADISALLSVAVAIAFLASLENTLMAKTLASKTGDRPDVNQDMLAVGAANLATAIAGGMPASGSLTRSMLNHESGARTRFSPGSIA